MQERLEEEPAVTLTVNISREVTVTDTSEALTLVFKLKGLQTSFRKSKDNRPNAAPVAWFHYIGITLTLFSTVTLKHILGRYRKLLRTILEE